MDHTTYIPGDARDEALARRVIEMTLARWTRPGDVTPHDDGIRLLASLQVILGQVLLLFGFAEIMRGREGRRATDNPSA